MFFSKRAFNVLSISSRWLFERATFDIVFILKKSMNGGPFKTGFGVVGDIQIFSILSSRPEQIIASSGDLQSGGTCCYDVAGCERRWTSNQNVRHENANERRRLCSAVELPHSSQNRA